MKATAKIEKMAMDSLKDKWSHLYQFGYPTRPFPTNYYNDLNCVMLGLMLAHSLKLEEDNVDKKYTRQDMINFAESTLNDDTFRENPSKFKDYGTKELEIYTQSLNKQD